MSERRTPLAQIAVLFLAVGVVLLVLSSQPRAHNILLFTSNHTGNFEIYTIDIETGSITQLTHTDSINEIVAAWSGDGTKIAFRAPAKVGEGYGIDGPVFVMNADGSDVHLLMEDDEVFIRTFAWSPTQHRLAMLLASQSAETSGIFVVNADGSDLHRILPYLRGIETIQWSPDGSKIAFMAYDDLSGLYVMDADGANLRVLAGNACQEFAWSPDGNSIAFSSVGAEFQCDLYLMDADGDNQRLLVEANVRFPSWSPDGKQIVFWIDFESGATEVYSVDIDGNNLRWLTENQEWDYLPQWSPDGKHIAYLNYGSIHLVDADGSHPRPLAENLGDIVSLEWKP